MEINKFRKFNKNDRKFLIKKATLSDKPTLIIKTKTIVNAIKTKHL